MIFEHKMEIGKFLLAIFPLLGLILFLVPWKKLKKSHYPLGPSPDGKDKRGKQYASDTIVMGYMQDPTIDPLDLNKEK